MQRLDAQTDRLDAQTQQTHRREQQAVTGSVKRTHIAVIGYSSSATSS
jgi:hypothetical protein